MQAAVVPRLDPLASLDPNVAGFASALQHGGFGGEIRTDYATRLSAATDNSIYQMLPAAVIFPAERPTSRSRFGSSTSRGSTRSR